MEAEEERVANLLGKFDLACFQLREYKNLDEYEHRSLGYASKATGKTLELSYSLTFNSDVLITVHPHQLRVCNWNTLIKTASCSYSRSEKSKAVALLIEGNMPLCSANNPSQADQTPRAVLLWLQELLRI